MADLCDGRLLFEMGLYKAWFPKDRVYVPTHFWFKEHAPGVWRGGMTAYAARLLTDLFRIDWAVKAGDTIAFEQVLGEVESTKAASELYSPLSASLLAINAATVDDPSLVGLDPYENWLLEFSAPPADSLSPDAYIQYLAAGWDETVKMLKGQV